MSKFYQINDDGTIKRKNRFCPRCGPGIFMADMYNRYVCGTCGFTEFKKKPEKKTKPAKGAKTAKKKKK